MATIEELCAKKQAEVVTGVLGPRQMFERKIFLLPSAAKWMREILPSLEPDGYVSDAITPKQQTYQLFKDFIAGEDMFGTEMHPKPLRPSNKDHGIWELRTPDLRFFGWFCAKGKFVVAYVATKAELLKKGSYDEYREKSVMARNEMELEHPKVLLGGPEDVF